MFLKNFFEEFLDVESTESVEKAVETRYGLPLQKQRIFRINGLHVLALRNPSVNISDCIQIKNRTGETDVSNVQYELPSELEELGVDEDDYKTLMETYKDDTIVRNLLLPYVFDRPVDTHAIFQNINKSNMINLDQFVKSVPDHEKDNILNNIDDYIESFINFN